MFKDKVYEDMDDISKMIEPFQYDLNDDLSKFPDKIEVKPEDIFDENRWGGYGASISDIVHKTAKQIGLKHIQDDCYDLVKAGFFKIEVEGEEEDYKPTVTVDVTTMSMSHKVFIVKEKIAFDEQELESMRKKDFSEWMYRRFSRSSDINKGRFNEIADIYGAELAKSERSSRGKVTQFVTHIEKLMDDKILDIRDMTLCRKFNNWIVLYVKDGNLAALNNLTRIKIITHEKRPIYSIEEKST